MMKLLVQGLAVASAVMVILTGAGTTHLVEAVTPSDLAQRGGNTQAGRILQVALPEFATVRLREGGSYTGELRDSQENKVPVATCLMGALLRECTLP